MARILGIILGAVAVVVFAPVLIVVGVLHTVLAWTSWGLHWLTHNLTEPVLDRIIAFAKWMRRKAGLPPHSWFG